MTLEVTFVLFCFALSMPEFKLKNLIIPKLQQAQTKQTNAKIIATTTIIIIKIRTKQKMDLSSQRLGKEQLDKTESGKTVIVLLPPNTTEKPAIFHKPRLPKA